MQRLTVQTADEYYSALLQHIEKAKKRIIVAAMVMVWGEKTGQLFKAIKKASERGVQVHMLFDAYTRTGFGVRPKQAFRGEILPKTVAFFEQLRQAGARVDEVGTVGINPFRGRCHVKISVVDDECFSFGGINGTDESFTIHDYMLHAHNPDLADSLAQLVATIGASKDALPDATTQLDQQNTLLFDGGKPKHSIIYDHAVSLSRQAKHVYYVSQMAPSGKLGTVLRHVQVDCYFNRPQQVVELPARWGLAWDQARYGTVNRYRGTTYIHAKFMLFELQDGTKALLSGSSNFSYRGVKFGTKEIALYSTDEELWHQLYNFLQKYIQ